MASFTLVAVVLAAVSSGMAQTDQSYCQISPSHTMCRFKGLAQSCGAPKARGVSDVAKNTIVDIHNKFRAKVANGQETRGRPGPQPAASNMLELQWDEELARIAQRWADQCQFGHDQNRRVGRFSVGQNVFQASSSSPAPADWNQAVKAWYDEVALSNRNVVDKYSFSAATGHYTQVAWASTTKIGCGLVTYKSGRWFNNYIVCNYGPAGNFIGSRMYQRGPACSACPSGTSCSPRYRGLCTGPLQSSSSEESNEIQVDVMDLEQEDEAQDNPREANAFGDRRHSGRGKFFSPFFPSFFAPLPAAPFFFPEPVVVAPVFTPLVQPPPVVITPVGPSVVQPIMVTSGFVPPFFVRRFAQLDEEHR